MDWFQIRYTPPKCIDMSKFNFDPSKVSWLVPNQFYIPQKCPSWSQISFSPPKCQNLFQINFTPFQCVTAGPNSCLTPSKVSGLASNQFQLQLQIRTKLILTTSKGHGLVLNRFQCPLQCLEVSQINSTPSKINQNGKKCQSEIDSFDIAAWVLMYFLVGLIGL